MCKIKGQRKGGTNPRDKVFQDERDPKTKMTGRTRTERETLVNRFIFLTNVLETNGTRCIVKVYTADVHGVQLGYVMPSDLNTGQHSSVIVCGCFDRSVFD